MSKNTGNISRRRHSIYLSSKTSITARNTRNGALKKKLQRTSTATTQTKPNLTWPTASPANTDWRRRFGRIPARRRPQWISANGDGGSNQHQSTTLSYSDNSQSSSDFIGKKRVFGVYTRHLWTFIVTADGTKTALFSANIFQPTRLTF